MRKISIEEITKNTEGRILRGTPGAEVSGVSTDTREIVRGDAFFALTGKRHDAHDFLGDAVAAGSTALIVERGETVPVDYDGAIILVSDTLAAYQNLASWYRQTVGPAVIAVTGSVGKTTLKDMIATAASARYRTLATEKNYNNHVGVPKTIFRMSGDTELLVLEMGMNHAGEIRLLTEIARPDAAVITNIGVSHRENFDSDNGILHAKLEVASLFGIENALFVNGDDTALRSHAERDDLPYDVVTAGESEGCDYRITHPEYTGEAEIGFGLQYGREATVQFRIPAAGRYVGVSAALAVAVLSRFGISSSEVAERLKEFERTGHRLNLMVSGGLRIIDDTYNASPDSMRSAIDYLSSFGGYRKIAVLAGMNELGEDSETLHYGVGEYAASTGVDILAAVGEKAATIADGFSAGSQGKSSVEKCVDNDDAISALLSIVKEGDVVLVKGSRAYGTEGIVSALVAGREAS
ncbi:MAG: UDP-N-acetylmuramoyl-tripeptide--D-alanyl-D-alanine ligase [Clostridiales Family XIII bacterium]|jgi:UDP-N-acetylmuramoyl-tripeptide--D-alanyl-D-alanine ligase|nr:UDP-N-acetylmuramoyl-tripeptide--D-alanyl-D-alanine ligase [Clostridiales Family XIII bacterium]